MSKKKGISRRNFIKGVGTGVVGSYVVVPALNNKAAKNLSDNEELQLKEGWQVLSLKVNGKKIITKVKPNTLLVDLLRNELQLTGTKVVCNQGECGGCTIILDGKPVYSCQMLALDANGKEVTTIEGLLLGEELHPLQQAFVDEDGLQCGFCTPGQIMAAYGLLLKYPDPTDEQILNGMSGNLCRCAAYPKIIKSVKAAASRIK